MPFKVPWSRLIRFVSAEDGQTYYGDAVVPSNDFDIGLPANLPLLQARVITGNPISADCEVTDKVVSVKKLLGPLTSETVPAVRCIGGNYLSHREHTIPSFCLKIRRSSQEESQMRIKNRA
jgi:hypothetical protein